MYARNRIYISEAEQQQVKACKIFLAGGGIGSVVAECALRMGFENITIVDGDVVELSNLNRQNYIHADIGETKTQSIKRRLLSINPHANIKIHDFFLTENNIEPLLNGHDIAINALDFQSKTPFVFDELCQRISIPVLHPYNIGWAALLFIIMPNNIGLSTISNEYLGFEEKAVKFFLNQMEQDGVQWKWIESVLTEYSNENYRLPPPQLPIGSWLLGGLCTYVLYSLATNKEVKHFPDYYYLSTR
jgi:molybdopterin-synthase adenylyltransferase